MESGRRLVARFPDPSFRICSKNSSHDDSYQPLVTGPLGANVLDVPKGTGLPTGSVQLDRLTSLDPMGPRVMLSLGDGNLPASIRPVGRPWMTGQLENQPGEPDYERTTQTRSGSESDTGTLHSVVRTEGEVYTGCVNTSVATDQTDPSGVLLSSDSVLYCPEEQIYQTDIGSGSTNVTPDSVIQTGGEVRTDGTTFGKINGQSESSIVSPSSDSGVHSLGEQWEYMSSCSGNSDSIRTIKTVCGDVASQTDSPQDTRGVVSSHVGMYSKYDSMSSMSTNGHNSDIADMSDFSDEEEETREEDGPHEDVQPNVRTDWIGDDTITKELYSGKESVLNTSTTGVGPHYLDPNDKEYWTKFRLLARQAFSLDDVKLAESDYPDAVKELVVRSRLTMMEIHDRNDIRFELCVSSDDESDSIKSDYDCYYSQYFMEGRFNGSTVVDIRTTDGDCQSMGNTGNIDGHGLTLDTEVEDNFDMCSEPDARANFELSPTKHVMGLDKIGVNCITDGDVTVHKGNVAGDSDTQENEYIRVSMISVDESRRGTSENVHKSIGIRDCVITESDLSGNKDSVLCNQDSLPIMTHNCFGVCGVYQLALLHRVTHYMSVCGELRTSKISSTMLCWEIGPR